jgi:O-antigen/teichoic acid export membrane protein
MFGGLPMRPDPNNLRKSVRYAIGEFLINLGLVFISYRIVAMQGGLEAIGLWSSLFAWTSLIRLGDVGMANAALRFAAVAPDSASAGYFIDTGILMNAALFAAISVVGFLALGPNLQSIAGAENLATATEVLPVLLVGFWLSNISGVVLGGVQGLHLGYRRSQISVACAGLQLIAVVALVPSFHLAGLAWAQIVQHLSGIVLGWIVTRKATQTTAWLPVRFRWSTLREMLHFSLAAQAANLANGLFEPISKIIIGHFSGLVVLGLYELAYKTVAMSRNVIAAAIGASLPALSSAMRTKRSDAVPLYRRAAQLTLRYMLALAVGLICLSPVISIVWLGHLDVMYCIFVAIIVAGFTVNTIGAPAYNLGTASGHQRGNLISNWLTLVFLIVGTTASAYLLPPYGPVVAASAALAFGGYLVRKLNEPLLEDI